jgi:Protein of unknown function (DUF4058)
MPTPFPGMDPYLERRGLWEDVHTGLITEIQQFLSSPCPSALPGSGGATRLSCRLSTRYMGWKAGWTYGITR